MNHRDEVTEAEAASIGYQHTGNCPRCGAPIYGLRSPTLLNEPTAHFTCQCRLTLPEPLPDVDPMLAESTEDADRKHLARHRPAAEPASEERVDG